MAKRAAGKSKKEMILTVKRVSKSRGGGRQNVQEEEKGTETDLNPRNLCAHLRASKNFGAWPFPSKVWPTSLLTVCMEGGQFWGYSIIFRITIKGDPELVF